MKNNENVKKKSVWGGFRDRVSVFIVLIRIDCPFGENEITLFCHWPS